MLSIELRTDIPRHPKRTNASLYIIYGLRFSNFYHIFKLKFLYFTILIAGQSDGCSVFPRFSSTNKKREYGFMLCGKKKYDRISVQLFYPDSWKV